MNHFLQSPELWPKMGQASLARSEPHVLKNTIHEYENFYRMVIEKHPTVFKPAKSTGFKFLDAYRSKKTIKQ